MKVINKTYLRKNLKSIIDTVINCGKSFVIQTKDGNAIILSEKEYRSMKETIFLSSVPNFVKKIKDGEKEDIQKLSIYSPDIDW